MKIPASYKCDVCQLASKVENSKRKAMPASAREMFPVYQQAPGFNQPVKFAKKNYTSDLKLQLFCRSLDAFSPEFRLGVRCSIIKASLKSGTLQ